MDKIKEPSSFVIISDKSSKSNIRWVQYKLVAWCKAINVHYLATVDGIFGRRTIAAVKAYQMINDLDLIDGIVGPETIEHMKCHKWEQLLPFQTGGTNI